MPDIYINPKNPSGGSSGSNSGEPPDKPKKKKKEAKSPELAEGKKPKKKAKDPEPIRSELTVERPVEEKTHTQTYLDLNSKNKEALDGYTKNPLSAFGYVPDKVSFDAIEEDENIVLFLRQHPITNVPWIIGAILLALAPFLLIIFPILAGVPENFQLIIILGWYLIVFAYILEKFLNWLFNIYIVTDERVVDIDFYNLLYKKVSSASLGRIQDISYKQGGTFATLFNYGDVMIQTAAEMPEFDYLRVPQPRRVVNVIRDLMEEFKLRKAKEIKNI